MPSSTVWSWQTRNGCTPAVDQPREFLRATKFRESLPLVSSRGALFRCKFVHERSMLPRFLNPHYFASLQNDPRMMDERIAVRDYACRSVLTRLWEVRRILVSGILCRPRFNVPLYQARLDNSKPSARQRLNATDASVCRRADELEPETSTG